MSYHILSMLCVCVCFFSEFWLQKCDARNVHSYKIFLLSLPFFIFVFRTKCGERKPKKNKQKQSYSSCDGTTMIFRDGENICLPFPFLPPGFLVLLFLQTNVQGWKAVHTLKIKMFRENRKSKIPDKLKCPRMRRNFVSGFKFVPFKDRHCLRMVTWWSETLEWRHRMYAPPTPPQ